MALQEEDTVYYGIEGHIARVRVNRPKSLNALNSDVLGGLLEAFDHIDRAPDVRCVILTGEGEKAFVAGADIANMNSLGPAAIADYVELGQRVMRRIETFKSPVIAAVNGFALGGGLELALSCDIIIAASSAKVGQPEVNLGIIPGFGGTQRLLLRCGTGVARRLVLTGDIISAEEAFSLGVIDMVVPLESLMETAQSMAERIAVKGPLAVSGGKRVINEAHESLLLSGLRHEVDEFLKLFSTEDRAEGMQAFLQKRAPEFKRK